MSTVTRPSPNGQRAARPSRARKPARTPHGIARLTLFINGTACGVVPLQPDPDAASKAYRLRKSDGTAYHVAQTVNGPSCDCPDFTFNRDGIDPGGCKHCRALAAVGLFDREGGAR
jgi:hypothetical protein